MEESQDKGNGAVQEGNGTVPGSNGTPYVIVGIRVSAGERVHGYIEELDKIATDYGAVESEFSLNNDSRKGRWSFSNSRDAVHYMQTALDMFKLDSAIIRPPKDITEKLGTSDPGLPTSPK